MTVHFRNRRERFGVSRSRDRGGVRRKETSNLGFIRHLLEGKGFGSVVDTFEELKTLDREVVIERGVFGEDEDDRIATLIFF